MGFGPLGDSPSAAAFFMPAGGGLEQQMAGSAEENERCDASFERRMSVAWHDEVDGRVTGEDGGFLAQKRVVGAIGESTERPEDGQLQ